MAELDEAAVRKRESWAQRQGVKTYIQEMGPYALQRDELVVRAMLGDGGGKLLDMPCGTGRFLELEKSLGFSVTAADYSPTMLSVAQGHAGVEVVRADIFNPPFAPDSFDVILICRLMFHYARPETILQSLLPALKPGGRIVFDTLNPLSARWWLSLLLGPVRRDPARRLYFESFGSMRRKLDALGLELIERRSCYILPTRSYRYLPLGVCKLIGCVESLVLPRLRVLTYWHVRRRGGAPEPARP